MKRVLTLFLLVPLLLAACGSGAPTPALAESIGDPAAGKAKFESTCAACHGMDAAGFVGLGKNLVTSEFAKGLTDQQLLEFVQTGRDTSDPLNTTGMQMPPRGGNPALSDKDLLDIIAYLRTLEK